MTAAAREYAESGWKEECLQSLGKRLREEADYESMSNPEAKESMRKRLVVQAADWCKARGMGYNWDEVRDIADKAINRYMMNWDGKTAGVDDHSHNFGKMRMKNHTQDALQNERNTL